MLNQKNTQIEKKTSPGQPEGQQEQQQQHNKLLVDPRDLVPERLRVLVVDSRSSSRANIVTILQDCAYQVGAVGSTAEAVDLLTHGKQGSEGSEAERFDLVIKEHEPPKIKATKLLRLLKSDDVLRLLPVVVMSFQDDREIVLRCLHLGAVDYLVKPLRKKELRNIWTKVWLHKVVVNCQIQGHDLPMYYPEIGQLTKEQVEDLMTASSVEELGSACNERQKHQCSDEEDEHEPTSKEGSAPDRSETKYQVEGDRTFGTNGNSGTKDHNNGSNGNGESTTLKPENPRALMGTAEGGINDRNQPFLLKDNAGGTQQQSIAAMHNNYHHHHHHHPDDDDAEYVREEGGHEGGNGIGKENTRGGTIVGWDGCSIQPTQQSNSQKPPRSGTYAGNQSATLDKGSDDTHQPLTVTATNKITSTSQDTNSLPLTRQQQQGNKFQQECLLQQQLPQSYLQDFGLIAKQILQSQLLSPLAIISALQTLKQQQQSISHDNSWISFQQQHIASQLMNQYALIQQQQQSLMQQQQKQQQLIEAEQDADRLLLSQVFLRNSSSNNNTNTTNNNNTGNSKCNMAVVGHGQQQQQQQEESAVYITNMNPQENNNKGFRNWQPRPPVSTQYQCSGGRCSEPQTPSLIYPSFSRCTKSLPILEQTQANAPCSQSVSSNPSYLNSLFELEKQQQNSQSQQNLQGLGGLTNPNAAAFTQLQQQNLLMQQQLWLDQEINLEKRATRQKAIDRFRIKKKNFHFGKRIRYETRRELAQQRSRHKGQFTSKRSRADDVTEFSREIKYQRVDDENIIDMNEMTQGAMDVTTTSKSQMQNIFNQEVYSRQGG